MLNIEVPGLPAGILVGMTCDVAIQVSGESTMCFSVPMVAGG